MAKKKTSFNVSQAVRDAMEKKPTGTGKEIVALVKTANPGQKFNETTAIVTWSKLRTKGKGRKSKRVMKPAATAMRHGANSGGNGVVAVIHAAKALILAAGGVEQAKRVIGEL